MTEVLHNGDAVEYLKSMESDTVDCVVTDPPYKVTSRGSAGTMGVLEGNPINNQLV